MSVLTEREKHWLLSMPSWIGWEPGGAHDVTGRKILEKIERLEKDAATPGRVTHRGITATAVIRDSEYPDHAQVELAVTPAPPGLDVISYTRTMQVPK